MRKFIFILCTVQLLISYSQSVDISGTWIGSSTFLKEHIQVRYELQQEGNQITGYAFSKSTRKGDSIKVILEGSLESNVVTLKGIEVVYRSGTACMANTRLNYAVNEGSELLTGRWKGSPALNTCPPLTSGSVSLVKEKASAPQIVMTDTREVPVGSTIDASDDVGVALINELSKRKYYALIIGINDYKDDDIQDLDNPIQDARKLANTLSTYYSFDQEYVSVLTNPKREEIINALDQLAQKVNEKDHLLIFFAGHGIWNAQLNQGYWLPSDASMDSKSYWLSNSTLRDYVGGIKSKHTLLVSDACFSGGILKERAVFENSKAILELYKLPSRKAMTSGTLKTVPDKSVFIEYLVKNLINNQSPLLSADQLFRSFKIAVINNSPNGQVPQYGPISQTGDEGGDFIFLKRD